MNCAAAESILDLYAEDRLSPAWRRAVAAHLKSCKRCPMLAEALGGLRRPPEAAPRAPSHLIRELEKLAQPQLKEAFVPATPRFRPDLSVLAAAAVYAAFLLVAAAAGPGVPSQQFSGAAPWEVTP